MKYSKEFKEQAIKLSDEIGIKQACAQLDLFTELYPTDGKVITLNEFLTKHIRRCTAYRACEKTDEGKCRTP